MTPTFIFLGRINMVRDALGRQIEYARISLTEACNFACPYCRPKVSDVTNKILTVEDWLKIMRACKILGIRAIRLTGGEPLLYPYLEELISKVKSEQLFEDISLTTNGSLLAEKIEGLKKAGLDRLNISLDGLTDEIFKERTGGYGELNAVVQGIKKAVDLGMQPIKINTVLYKAFSKAEMDSFIKIINEWPVVWRFIEYMPFQGEKYKGPSFTEWKQSLEETLGYTLEPTTIDKGFGPAQYYKLDNGNKIGFIFPITNPYCEGCNRIRITSEGSLRLCLLRPEEFNLVDDNFAQESAEKIAEKIKNFLELKHESHSGYDSNPEKGMWKIGG